MTGSKFCQEIWHLSPNIQACLPNTKYGSLAPIGTLFQPLHSAGSQPVCAHAMQGRVSSVPEKASSQRCVEQATSEPSCKLIRYRGWPSLQHFRLCPPLPLASFSFASLCAASIFWCYYLDVLLGKSSILFLIRVGLPGCSPKTTPCFKSAAISTNEAAAASSTRFPLGYA